METSTRAPRGPSAGSKRRSIASTRLKWPRLFATTNGRWSNCSVVCSTPCAIWTPRTTSDEPVAYDNMTPASHQPSRFVQFAHQPGAHGTDSSRNIYAQRSRSKKVSATLVEESSRVSEFWDGRFLMEQLRGGSMKLDVGGGCNCFGLRRLAQSRRGGATRQRAADRGAQYVQLPEYFNFLGPSRDLPTLLNRPGQPPFECRARPVTRPDTALGSLLEVSPIEGKFYNTSVVIGPDGESSPRTARSISSMSTCRARSSIASLTSSRPAGRSSSLASKGLTRAVDLLRRAVSRVVSKSGARRRRRDSRYRPPSTSSRDAPLGPSGSGARD